MTMQSTSDLAIFGAAPAFNEPLHVGRPNIGNKGKFYKRLDDILDRRWLTNAGLYVGEFEQKVASYLGVKHCIAICNGTIALEIAIRALGLTGEVILPSFTFVATASALRWQGITPVFCDIDYQTYGLDWREIERAITPRTTGIIGVHVFGRPCATEMLTSIAKGNGLPLLFDAAHAFGCSHGGRMIGNFGNAEVFSFHATKFFNTFEGGAIATNDDELAERVRLMKNFGFAGHGRVVLVGTNGKMSEVSAAMGLTGLECLRQFIVANKRNYMRYKRELWRVYGVRLMEYNEAEKCNYQYIVLEIDESVTSISRNQLVTVLLAENVLARSYFSPGCHQMEPYLSEVRLPITEKLSSRVLSLPTGTAVSGDQISKVCEIIQFTLENGREIASLLGDH